ncbi:unnamed protein product [Arabidopsis thaliana]|uniref:Uncharacterized protein n=2 Tax=Arabidopsis thaliana TaxID=3702 RepID=A0A654F4I4_ARATH|nr:DUF241 domain protein, putative (DUF241) [Arabidopsis thaliana]pir/B84555/ hypothetical protein At2g17680 [imported] - Arabidopsis thaliana [Arabidopsis thaliana]AAT69206.1 hypothetical protein At2g17680 [Arabidopsis thaliana]AEC06665.1 DUF241 domain protein, putative (DUF241) [Arabidopsis thaliana]CAA0364401.1 unnamed protein product [Arabidopsis thaliana]VYS52661.1 unnamed protein product [Arabidopsis thaliana]|eukprot:NP_179359.1 DUF241 domain protein, putative (DUF241) [Arabidopsis thaliana]
MVMMMIKNHVRSISLQSRSHPSTAAIEESLDKFLITMNTSTMASSESVHSGLSGLEDLYDCSEDLLKMGSTQRVLSFSDEKKKKKRKVKGEFMEEMLDGSLRLMDICNVSRDLMVETHEHVLGLQSCVRRRKDVDVSGYVGFRKNMRKEVKKLLGSLKNINVGLVMRDHGYDQDGDIHFLAVIHAMRRVVYMTVSVLKSFFEFLSGRQNGNDVRSKLALVLMNKKFHDHDKMVKNELENVDSAICGDSISHDDLHEKLEEVEVWIGKFEKSLEGLFRGLIKTRASLLNIISQ